MTTGLYWFGAVVVATGGLVLLAWALVSDRSRRRKRCPKCWYLMEQTPSRRCPECGHEAKREKHMYRTRRRWKWAMVSVLPFLLAAFLALQPKAQSDGWASIMPTTVLIAAMYMDDHEWALPHIEDRTNTLHEDAMSAWQWRWLARQSIRKLDRDNLSFRETRWYVLYMMLSAESSEDDGTIDASIRTIIRLFDHDDPRVQQTALIFSTDHRDYEGSIYRVLPYLDHEEEGVRLGAVTTLRLIRYYDNDARAQQHLIDALVHECNRVRLLALGAVTSPIDSDELSVAAKRRISAMGDDPSADVREYWVGAMRAILDKHDMRALQRDMFESDDIALRRGGFHSLYYDEPLPSEFHLDIINALGEDDHRVRQYASGLVISLPTNVLAEHQALLQELHDANDPVTSQDIARVLQRVEQFQSHR